VQIVSSLGAVPVPSIEGMPPGTLLIRTVVTSICGSDLSGQPCASCDVGAWRGFTQEMPRGGFVGNQQGSPPFSVGPPSPGGSGHELMGEVVAYVAPTDEVNIGDRVLAMSAGWGMTINRKQFEARTGVSARVLLPVTSGGFLEYFVTTVDNIVPVPPPPHPSFNPLWYVAAQPFGTIIKAAAKLDSVLTKTVCIMGQGQNGLMMTSLIKSMGAKTVVVCDLFQNRLDIAKQMGATHAINCAGLDREATVDAIREVVGGGLWDPAGGADVCIDMAGHQGETLAILGDVAARGGKMLIFGLPPHSDSRFTGRNGVIGQGRTIGDGSFVGNTDSDMSISYAHLTKNLCV
jgi:threonine dehydrogenase-like Zn-dependent dehydrogenase